MQVVQVGSQSNQPYPDHVILPQRSLESPKIHAPLPPNLSGVTSSELQYSSTTAPRPSKVTSSEGASRIPAWDQSLSKTRGVSSQGGFHHGGGGNAAAYFQRQDSLPMTRGLETSYGYGTSRERDGGRSTGYQDVSQITAVQVPNCLSWTCSCFS